MPFWRRVHEELLRIARARTRLDWEEGRWLLRARRAGTPRRLGYGSILEYAERLFGYEPRVALERLRVAEALERLPELSQALQSGKLCWSSVRELTRVATRDTEEAWIAAALDKPVRQVEALVAGLRPGDLPGDIGDPRERKHVVRLELSGEAYATFREAVRKLRADAGGELDDEAAILLMARAVLGGPSDEGRSSYQVAITVCSRCQTGWQLGRGEQVPVSAEVVERAFCDAQTIGGSAHVGAAGAAEEGAGSAPVRAKQTIPPATRRLVMRRDQGRCAVPGCRHATFVDVHHIQFRSEGGDHHPDNLVVLCSAHHSAVHDGRLIIEKDGSHGLAFFHADGTPYGTGVTPALADACARAFAALRHLGFKESEARARVRAARAHVGAGEVEPDVEELVRRALQVTLPS